MSRSLFKILAFNCVFGALLSACGSSGGDSTSATKPPVQPPMSANMVTNPVASNGHDPWVVRKDDLYYYLYSEGGAIYLNSATKLQQAVQFEGQIIWQPNSDTAYSKNIWAPEMFFIEGHWFIYFAADNGENANHRMHVLKSATDDPYSAYSYVGKVTDYTDKWAIDGTIFAYREALYFIWSGWEGDENIQQNLYIAKMSGPTQISEARVLISQPEYDWERIGEPWVNEGPEIIRRNDDIFIIYSASGSWTDHYALGQLRFYGNDPTNPDAWEKHPSPVFQGTDKVFSPGHASFTQSPNGAEDWIIYHSAKYKGAGWNRDVSIQPFTWFEDGSPNFGAPIDKGIPIPAPAE